MDTSLDRANIECKLVLADRAAAEGACRALGGERVGVLEQTDTYYPCAQGRLKRRETRNAKTEWILYERTDARGARESRYMLLTDAQARSRFPDPGEPTIVVRKKRTLWMLGNVRVHLDEVEGLGEFLEFEAVVGPGHDRDACAQRVDELLRAFAPALGEHVPLGYADLLRTKRV